MKASLLVLSMFSMASAAFFAAGAGYQVVERLPLGAATKWDCIALDEIRQRLFVTRGDHIDVVAVATGKIISTIADTQGVHGVALAQDLKLGFTSNGKTNSVTVFDLDSLKPSAEIKVTGANPDAILYEASVHKLFVFNGGSANVDVIDAKTLKVIATVKATGRPEFAVTDGKGKIYFNIEDNAGINVIDVASSKVIASWRLEGCDEPTGLAIDIKSSRLFSACRNSIMAVTDARTGRRITQFSIGEKPDAVIFDEETRTVLTSGGGGTGSLTVTNQDDADHYSLRGSVVTENGAKTMVMDGKSKTVFLPTVVGNKFVVLVVAKHQ